MRLLLACLIVAYATSFATADDVQSELLAEIRGLRADIVALRQSLPSAATSPDFAPNVICRYEWRRELVYSPWHWDGWCWHHVAWYEWRRVRVCETARPR